jgi:hypothetical protein
MLSTQAILFISLTIILSTVLKIIQRYVLKETEPYAYSLLTQFIAALIWLPITIAHFKAPTEITAWIVLTIAGILWAAVSLWRHLD